MLSLSRKEVGKMIEKFTGLPGVESYNLFSKEEYHDFSTVIARLHGNTDEKWHIGMGILMDYGSLGFFKGMADGNLCGMRQLNLAAPRLYVNEVSTQYKLVPHRVSQELFKELTTTEGEWRILAKEVKRIKWVSREVDTSIVRVAFESFQLNPSAIRLSRQANESITVAGDTVFLTVTQVKRLKEENIPVHLPVKKGEELGEPIDVDQLIEELTAREEKRYYQRG